MESRYELPKLFKGNNKVRDEEKKKNKNKDHRTCTHWQYRLAVDVLIILLVVFGVFMLRELLGWMFKTTMTSSLAHRNNLLLHEVLSHIKFISASDMFAPIQE
jgi:hypothetical protein